MKFCLLIGQVASREAYPDYGKNINKNDMFFLLQKQPAKRLHYFPVVKDIDDTTEYPPPAEIPLLLPISILRYSKAPLIRVPSDFTWDFQAF